MHGSGLLLLVRSMVVLRCFLRLSLMGGGLTLWVLGCVMRRVRGLGRLCVRPTGTSMGWNGPIDVSVVGSFLDHRRAGGLDLLNVVCDYSCFGGPVPVAS